MGVCMFVPLNPVTAEGIWMKFRVDLDYNPVGINTGKFLSGSHANGPAVSVPICFKLSERATVFHKYLDKQLN